MNDELGRSSTPQSEPDDKAGRRLHELMAAESDRIERDFADHDPITFTRRLAARIIAGKS